MQLLLTFPYLTSPYVPRYSTEYLRTFDSYKEVPSTSRTRRLGTKAGWYSVVVRGKEALAAPPRQLNMTQY